MLRQQLTARFGVTVYSDLGIAHSEVSTAATTNLHGVQLWVALPDSHRNTEPQFHHVPEVPREEARGGSSDARRRIETSVPA